MSRLRRKRRSRSGPEAEIGTRGPIGSRLGVGRRIEITAAFLAIVGFGFLIGPKVEGFIDDGEDVRLETAEVAVANVPAEYSTPAGFISQVPSTEPRIEATVRNRGEDTAWIEAARITILASAHLPVCLSQGGGDVPRSKRYRISLPDFPRPERRLVRHDLHVEVQPGHGVRPVLTFENGGLDTTTLYAIRVKLVADPGAHVLDLGRFVIGVPEPASRDGLVFPESEAVFRSEIATPGQSLPSACFRHNLRGLRRVIAEPGQRSGYLAALAHVRAAPGWKSYADRRPARRIVSELLAGDEPEAAIYAVEAAERTGNERYEKRVRERAVSWLLRLGRDDLAESYPQGAVEAAERTLSLTRSAAAKHLLWEAEARESAGAVGVRRSLGRGEVAVTGHVGVLPRVDVDRVAVGVFGPAVGAGD